MARKWANAFHGDFAERWYVGLLLMTVLVGTCVSGARPFVIYRAIELGADQFWVGLVGAAFSTLSFALASRLGTMADVSGARAVCGFGIWLAAVSCFLLAFVDALPLLALLHGSLGLGHVATIVGAQTLVSSLSTAANMGRLVGVYAAFVSLSQLTGPLLLTYVVDRGGFSAQGIMKSLSPIEDAFLVGAMVGICGWLAIRLIPGQRDQAVERVVGGTGQAIGKVLRMPSMAGAIFTSMAVLASSDLFLIFLPLYAETVHISVATVGGILAVRAGASLAARFFVGPLSDRFGLRAALVGSLVALSVSISVFPLSTDEAALYVLAVCIGFAFGCAQPMTLVWANFAAPAEMKGAAVGVRLAGNRSAGVILPPLGGIVATLVGVPAAFACGGALVLISVFSARRMQFGRPLRPVEVDGAS